MDLLFEELLICLAFMKMFYMLIKFLLLTNFNLQMLLAAGYFYSRTTYLYLSRIVWTQNHMINSYHLNFWEPSDEFFSSVESWHNLIISSKLSPEF